MKTALTLVMTLGLTVAFGCGSKSSSGGGAAKDEGFKIVVPSGTTQIKQGDTQTVTLSLQRGDNFKRDVKLDIKASQGLTVDPTSLSVKAGDKPEVQLRITAPRDAAVADYKIFVTGTPATGERADVDFTVKVVAP